MSKSIDNIPGRPRFKRKLIVVPLVGLLTVVLGLLAADAVFRRVLGDDFFPNFAIPDADVGWSMIPNRATRQIALFAKYSPDPQNWIRNRFQARINSRGFRGADPSPADDDKYRIVFVGDSSTYGWGEREEVIYPTLIARALDKIKPVVAYNLGVTSYSSEQGLRVFKNSLPWTKPDFISVSFVSNEPSETTFTLYHPMNPFPNLPDRKLFGPSANLSASVRLKMRLLRFVGSKFSNSATLCWLFWRAAAAAERGEGPKGNGVPRLTIEEYTENMEAFADYAAEKKIPIVYVLFCVQKEEYVEAAKKVAAERGAPILIDRDLYVGTRDEIASRPGYAELVREVENRYGADTIRQFPKLLFTNDYCDPNPLGHRIVADAMTAIMTPMIPPKAP